MPRRAVTVPVDRLFVKHQLAMTGKPLLEGPPAIVPFRPHQLRRQHMHDIVMRVHACPVVRDLGRLLGELPCRHFHPINQGNPLGHLVCPLPTLQRLTLRRSPIHAPPRTLDCRIHAAE